MLRVWSPLAQGRELKYNAYMIVVHHVASPLAQGRELKYCAPPCNACPLPVAPRAGAGIEIRWCGLSAVLISVAPRAGAGIEIRQAVNDASRAMSPLAQGRELK